VLDWQTVQPKVASFSRVCSYDRSGIGWSESLSRARADKQINEFEASRQDLSENSELVVANNSAHYIHFERPELVVDSIRRVANAARWHGL
jgi:pimeloyl-ACP methyl ester carboxylesterase